MMTSQKHGILALGVQRALGLGSYETAWAMPRARSLLALERTPGLYTRADGPRHSGAAPVWHELALSAEVPAGPGAPFRLPFQLSRMPASGTPT